MPTHDAGDQPEDRAEDAGASPMDLFGKSEPGPTEEPTEEPVADGTDEPEGEPEPSTEEPEPQPEQPPAGQPWKFSGRAWTDEELKEKFGDPDTIKDLLVAREQARHFQGKYTDILEQLRAAQQAPQQQKGQPAQPLRWAMKLHILSKSF